MLVSSRRGRGTEQRRKKGIKKCGNVIRQSKCNKQCLLVIFDALFVKHFKTYGNNGKSHGSMKGQE